MAENDSNLPEGTDSIIEGASGSPGASPGGTGGSGPELRGTGTGVTSETGSQASAGTALVPDAPESGRPAGAAGTQGPGRVADRIRSGRDKISGQAADKARGLVGQGLERGSEALANVGRMIGDTATGLDERLGEEYGDYARRAASAIESTANSLASKDADELIDDTRNFVRKSPGVALAGAAIVGFALARLIKSGLDRDEGEDGGSSGGNGGGSRA